MPAFPTTRWSVVAAAGGDGAAARVALGWLCERCWEPLRAHARRRGFRDDEDQVQAFYVSLIERRAVARADAAKGRFRTWLLACFDNHLAHAAAARAAAKRGGGHMPSDIDDGIAAPPDDAACFDRDWAMQLLDRAADQIAQSEMAASRGDRFTRLRPFLVRNGEAASYADAGADLGLEVGAVRVAVHRLRSRFATVVRELIAETLAEATPQAIDAELDHLLAAVRSGL